MEIWESIKGFDNYEISNLGQVRRLDSYVRSNSKVGMRFQKGRTNQIATNTIGYKNARLWNDGVEHTIGVHVLVARSFIPNPDNKPDVNHINGVRDDNRVENLEWCTASENARHAIDILKKDFAPYKKAVLCITNGLTYKSAYEAARELRLNRGHVAAVCRGAEEHHKKYQFKYI